MCCGTGVLTSFKAAEKTKKHVTLYLTKTITGEKIAFCSVTSRWNHRLRYASTSAGLFTVYYEKDENGNWSQTNNIPDDIVIDNLGCLAA